MSDTRGIDRFKLEDVSTTIGAPIFLLTIEYGSRSFRFSTSPVVVDDDGDSVPFDGGLDPVDFAERLDLFSSEPDLASVSFRGLQFPINIAEWEERGVDFSTARGRLSLWLPGTDYSKRRDLVSGDVVKPTYGYEGEPVALSVEADLYEDRSVLPPSTAVVSLYTWSSPADNAQGMSYPEILGTPGVYTDTTGTEVLVPSSPAPVVVYDTVDEEADKLLVAGHEVAATAVTIFDGVASEAFAVTEEEDNLGRKVSTVDITGALIIDRTAGDYRVAWHSGGGRLKGDRSGIMTGAGEILRYYLLRSSLNIDEGRVAAATALLDVYKVSTYLDSPAPAWTFLRELILPLLPVSIVAGVDGLYPIVWRYDANVEDAVAHLTAAPGFVLRGSVEKLRRRREIVNGLRLGWAVDGDSKESRRVYVVLPASEWTPGAGEYRSGYATRSSTRYHNKDGSPFVSVVSEDFRAVYDGPTIARVADWKLREGAFIPRRFTYDGDFNEYGHLERGDVVTLTDDGLALDSRIALVESAQLTPAGGIVIELLVNGPPQ